MEALNIIDITGEGSEPLRERKERECETHFGQSGAKGVQSFVQESSRRESRDEKRLWEKNETRLQHIFSILPIAIIVIHLLLHFGLGITDMAYAQVMVDSVPIETIPIQNSDVTLGSYEGALPSESFAVFPEDSMDESILYVDGHDIALNMEEVYQHDGENYYRYDMVFQLDTEIFSEATEVRKTFWSLSADLNEGDIQFMGDSVSVGSGEEGIYEYDGDLKSDLLEGHIDKERLEAHFFNDDTGNVMAFSVRRAEAIIGYAIRPCSS